jgi:hypothetical protein
MPPSRTVSTTVSLHSPRWGHGDPYTFVFDATGVTVEGTKGAHYNGATEKWSGHRGAHALLNCITDDSIHAPSVVEFLVSNMWRMWKNHELADEEVTQALIELGTWIDAVTHARPRSELFERLW